MRRSQLALSALIVVVASVVPVSAWADEAYICEGGRIQYVRVDELAAMKLTDPCIAGYYGLLPMPPPDLKAQKAGPAPAGPRVIAAVVKQTSKPMTAAAPALKKLQDPLESESDRPSRTAAIAAPNTDFRNVRVLNSVTGETEWYRHGQ